MTNLKFFATLAVPVLHAVAQEYSWHQPAMCTEGSCGDCPNRLLDSTGYPVCAWYDVDNSVWKEQFSAVDQGGLEVYFDIAQPDPGCAVVVRSPAGSEYIGCGQNILSTYNALCTRLVLRQRVMLQFCCGTGDCTDAGAGQPMLLTRDELANTSIASAAGGGGGGVYLFVDNKGNVIRPDSETNEREQRLQARTYEMAKPKKREEQRHARNFHARQDDCTFNQMGDPFTAPGDTRVIDGPVTGPATIDRGVDQTVGWTSTFEVGLTFEIFSAGASFSVEESVTESASVQLEVEDSVTGYWVWTPILTCARGELSGSCSGEGQACSPTVNGDGNVVGNTAFQIRG